MVNAGGRFTIEHIVWPYAYLQQLLVQPPEGFRIVIDPLEQDGLIADVYAAGESPIAGADGRAMARAIRSRGSVEPVFVESLEDLPDVLGGLLADGDLVLTAGAGDIGAFATTLPERLAGDSSKEASA